MWQDLRRPNELKRAIPASFSLFYSFQLLLGIKWLVPMNQCTEGNMRYCNPLCSKLRKIIMSAVDDIFGHSVTKFTTIYLVNWVPLPLTDFGKLIWDLIIRTVIGKITMEKAENKKLFLTEKCRRMIIPTATISCMITPFITISLIHTWVWLTASICYWINWLRIVLKWKP